MRIIKQTESFLNSGQEPIDHCDQPMHDITRKIQLKIPEYFEHCTQRKWFV